MRTTVDNRGKACLICDRDASVKGYCSRCYSYIRKDGKVPRCNQCGKFTSRHTRYGKHRVYQCPECKAAVRETMYDIINLIEGSRAA